MHVQRQPPGRMRVKLEWSGVASAKRDAEESAQRQAVGASCHGNGQPLGVEALKIADKEHAEVNAGQRDRLAADPSGGVVARQRSST